METYIPHRFAAFHSIVRPETDLHDEFRQDMACWNEKLEQTSLACSCYQASQETITIAELADSVEDLNVQRGIFPDCARVPSALMVNNLKATPLLSTWSFERLSRLRKSEEHSRICKPQEGGRDAFLTETS